MKIEKIQELRKLASYVTDLHFKSEDGERVGKPPFVLEVKQKLNLPLEYVVRELGNQVKKIEDDNDRSYGMLVASILALGILDPILIQKDKNRKMRLLDGNRRIQAAIGLEIKKVPVVFLKSKYQLTPLL